MDGRCHRRGFFFCLPCKKMLSNPNLSAKDLALRFYTAIPLHKFLSHFKQITDMKSNISPPDTLPAHRRERLNTNGFHASRLIAHRFTCFTLYVLFLTLMTPAACGQKEPEAPPQQEETPQQKLIGTWQLVGVYDGLGPNGFLPKKIEKWVHLRLCGRWKFCF